MRSEARSIHSPTEERFSGRWRNRYQRDSSTPAVRPILTILPDGIASTPVYNDFRGSTGPPYRKKAPMAPKSTLTERAARAIAFACEEIIQPVPLHILHSGREATQSERHNKVPLPKSR